MTGSDQKPRERHLKVPVIKKQTINAAEAIGLVVRSYDQEMAFEKATEDFANCWGFDPSQEDLRRLGRREIVEAVRRPESPNRLPQLLRRQTQPLSPRFLRDFLRALITYERYQKGYGDLWDVACKQLIQWIAEGMLEASGRPAFLDGHRIDADKQREIIPTSAAGASTTAFVPVPGKKAENYAMDYWLVRNYVDIFDDRFGEYHSTRPSWAEVQFRREDILTLTGLSFQKLPPIPHDGAKAVRSQLVNATDPVIRNVLTEIYDHAEQQSMKPPNLKEVGAFGKALLAQRGYQSSQSHVSKVAEDEDYKTRRGPVGRTIDGRFRAFSLESFKKSGSEI